MAAADREERARGDGGDDVQLLRTDRGPIDEPLRFAPSGPDVIASAEIPATKRPMSALVGRNARRMDAKSGQIRDRTRPTWARTFGVGRLGELQGVGESARIGAAALGPLPLALALSVTGTYGAGLALLAVLALGCAAAGLRLPRPVTRVATA
jgi:hypothetical protein